MNRSEMIVYEKYIKQGYDVIKTGIPDFVMLKSKKIKFVEVKYRNGNLSDAQKRAFNLLQDNGFDVIIERVNKKDIVQSINIGIDKTRHTKYDVEEELIVIPKHRLDQLKEHIRTLQRQNDSLKYRTRPIGQIMANVMRRKG